MPIAPVDGTTTISPISLHVGIQSNQVNIYAGTDSAGDFTYSLENYMRQPRFGDKTFSFEVATAPSSILVTDGLAGSTLTASTNLYFGEVFASIETDLTVHSLSVVSIGSTINTNNAAIADTLAAHANIGYVIDSNGNDVLVPGTLDKVMFLVHTSAAEGGVSDATNTQLSFVSRSGTDGALAEYVLPVGQYRGIATTSWTIATASRYNIVGRSPYARDDSYEEIAQALSAKPKSIVELTIDGHTELSGTSLNISCSDTGVWSLLDAVTPVNTVQNNTLPIGFVIEPNGWDLYFNTVKVPFSSATLTVANNVQNIQIVTSDIIVGDDKSLYNGSKFELVWR